MQMPLLSFALKITTIHRRFPPFVTDPCNDDESRENCAVDCIARAPRTPHESFRVRGHLLLATADGVILQRFVIHD